MQKNILGVMVLGLMVLFPFSAHADTLWSTSGLNIYNTNTGNVGVGMINSTDGRLQVLTASTNGDAVGLTLKNITNLSANTKISQTFFADNNEMARITVGRDGTSTAGTFNILTAKGSSPTSSLYIDTVGNIGIGTAAPTSLLHIVGLSPTLNLTNTNGNGGTGGVLKFGDSQAGATVPSAQIFTSKTCGGACQAADLIFQTATGNTIGTRMVIQAAGNVGIGTTTPTAKLDVNGNIKLSGNIISDGDICIGICQ